MRIVRLRRGEADIDGVGGIDASNPFTIPHRE